MCAVPRAVTLAEALALAERAAQSDRLGEAETLYRAIVSELENRLGIVCGQRRELDAAALSFRESIRLRPDQPAPHSNLGNVLRLKGELDAAVAAFGEALRLQPAFPDACNNVGLAFMRQGRIREAEASFRKALADRSSYPTAASNLLLCLNYMRGLTAQQLLAEHQRWPASLGPLGEPAPYSNERVSERRLRVGYVSPDFCGHVVAYFLLPLLANHDPQKVDVFCYSHVFDADSVTRRFQRLGHTWRPITALDDQAAAEQIRRDQIDILVDLAGHTADNRLGVFARKPAPVQVTYLGYPNTTGLPTIDYRITDEVADPPGEPVAHTEELMRVRSPFCCYEAPDAPPVRSSPAARNGFVTFGSTHDLAKLNGSVVALWAGLLRHLPDTRLLIFRHTLLGSARGRLVQLFAEHGIGADRLSLESTPAASGCYLGIYDEIDVLLDTLPWNGHVTTCEALWMGVPVLTLTGDRHAGRLSATVLSAVGLEQFICRTPADLVERARRVCEPGELVRLRAGLRERVHKSPLCDAKSLAVAVEGLYRTMWRRWCDAAR